jgi:hypothetical protein
MLSAMFTGDLRLNFNTTIKIDLTNRKIENDPTRGTVLVEHAPLIEPVILKKWTGRSQNRGAEVEPFEIKERCERDFCIPHNILKIFSTVAKDSLG